MALGKVVVVVSVVPVGVVEMETVDAAEETVLQVVMAAAMDEDEIEVFWVGKGSLWFQGDPVAAVVADNQWAAEEGGASNLVPGAGCSDEHFGDEYGRDRLLLGNYEGGSLVSDMGHGKRRLVSAGKESAFRIAQLEVGTQDVGSRKTKGRGLLSCAQPCLPKLAAAQLNHGLSNRRLCHHLKLELLQWLEGYGQPGVLRHVNKLTDPGRAIQARY